MNKEFLEKQRASMESDVARLEAEIKKAKSYDDLGGSPDDATQEFEEFEGKTAITNEKERELFELKDCLKRMDEGTYGICEKCGSPIEESRLKAYPGAIHCSTHAS